MEIKSVKHKALKALMAAPNAASVKGLDAAVVKKLRAQITMMEAAANIGQLQSVPGWKVHDLKPKYPGKWSMWVTGNYRLTFYLDQAANTVTDLDYEDYH
jgi:proteic killer suppression protein